jgi:hypothetical protein
LWVTVKVIQNHECKLPGTGCMLVFILLQGRNYTLLISVPVYLAHYRH